MSTEFQELTKDEARRIVANHPHDWIHCFMDFIGADWQKDEVLAEIDKCDRVAWSPHRIRHELAIKTGDIVARFDIQKEAA